MTKEKQNIAIAQFAGWTDIKLEVRGSGAPERRPSPYGFPPGKKWKAPVPNFTGSLDACHSVIKDWKLENITKLSNELKLIMMAEKPLLNSHVDARYMTLTASADQLCEALLKTIGRWEEE